MANERGEVLRVRRAERPRAGTFTVALIGPDGAGKTTISRELPSSLPFRTHSVYMGVNLDASKVMLPTTRLILALKRLSGRGQDMVASVDPHQMPNPGGGITRRIAKSIKSGLRMANWVGEEWFRQAIAWRHQLKGRVVVFDRHFFCDYYAYDVAQAYGRRPLANRIHGLLLSRAYPKPDLVIYLDAPVEILFDRKRETTREFLERRRQEYLQMRDLFPHFALVDATQPKDKVKREVADIIINFRNTRTVSERGL
ncbi:MAG: dTMP kinase [Actinomycetota bacterium]